MLILLQKGDEVEYRPIGGAADNVSHSTGTITEVVQAEGVSRTSLLSIPASTAPIATLLCISSFGAHIHPVGVQVHHPQ